MPSSGSLINRVELAQTLFTTNVAWTERLAALLFHAPGTPLGDIYALGAVLYFLLTGQPPFTGATPRDVLARIREGEIERPSKLQRGIPAPFEAALLLMMARRPEERFPTAAEMLDAVERIALEHEIEV
jgi:serine/threonine protein kinase